MGDRGGPELQSWCHSLVPSGQGERTGERRHGSVFWVAASILPGRGHPNTQLWGLPEFPQEPPSHPPSPSTPGLHLAFQQVSQEAGPAASVLLCMHAQKGPCSNAVLKFQVILSFNLCLVSGTVALTLCVRSLCPSYPIVVWEALRAESGEP